MFGGGTKLVFPGLAGFYATMQPITYTLLRVAAGALILAHGWGKVTGGAAGVIAFFTKVGLPAPTLLAYSAMFLETAGAICVIVGLLTRFFAAALAVEMLIAMFSVHWVNGFNAGKGGYEFVLMLGLVLFAVAIRGGGPYSVDAKIGKEL